MNNIYKQVVEFLKKYKLEDKTIIVGFSGGYDSMCLLDILSKIREKENLYDMTIIAAHFNHNWRGEESLREQEICKIFATSKGIEFFCKEAPKNIKKTENDARIARYNFFEDTLDAFDADAVFTAHNKDDNAETVLYRIIKGTGIVGLKGIAEHRDCYYRPLLKTTRAEIVNYCETNNLTPNNDSSNSNTDYRRNYLRLNVIPSIEKINENVKEALNILSYNASNDNEIIEEYLQTIRPNIYQNDKIISNEYKKLSIPIKKRLLHEYIQKLDLDYDYKKINEIYEFIENNITQRNGSTLSLATALWLYADDKFIETIPPKITINKETIKENIIISQKEGEFHFGNKILTIKPYIDNDIFIFPEATSNFAYVDFSHVTFPLTIRHRQDGDTITPFGMTGSMKLKKYLNAKGISRHNRDELFLLCNNENEILWVIGVGLSNKIKVKTKPTHVLEII